MFVKFSVLDWTGKHDSLKSPLNKKYSSGDDETSVVAAAGGMDVAAGAIQAVGLEGFGAAHDALCAMADFGSRATLRCGIHRPVIDGLMLHAA